MKQSWRPFKEEKENMARLELCVWNIYKLTSDASCVMDQLIDKPRKTRRYSNR